MAILIVKWKYCPCFYCTLLYCSFTVVVQQTRHGTFYKNSPSLQIESKDKDELECSYNLGSGPYVPGLHVLWSNNS